MAAVFERIRAAVLQEATRPSPDDAQRHAANKEEFKAKLQEICTKAHLRADLTADDLWRHVWTKIRYAGFKASYVGPEIERLGPFLSEFRVLTGPVWRFDPTGKAHGKAVREFLEKSGRFEGIRYNKNASKLRKILLAAEVFRALPSGTPALAALFGDDYDEPGDEVLWRAHSRLAKLVGYTTALHVMMDIGFNCVKPDIWLVRLMCRLGWIEDTLRAASTDAEIRKSYQAPAVARAVITCARQIAGAMTAWHPEAPLREFDLIMVKYGQRRLHAEFPVERIMQWHPGSGFPPR